MDERHNDPKSPRLVVTLQRGPPLQLTPVYETLMSYVVAASSFFFRCTLTTLIAFSPAGTSAAGGEGEGVGLLPNVLVQDG